jgi:hypothetical protein
VSIGPITTARAKKLKEALNGLVQNIWSKILVNRGCTNFVIYFHLTCGLPIWLGFFFYKNVAAGFGYFLVPLGSLMSYSIISKCGKDSLIMFQNPFLTRIPYSS